MSNEIEPKKPKPSPERKREFVLYATGINDSLVRHARVLNECARQLERLQELPPATTQEADLVAEDPDLIPLLDELKRAVERVRRLLV